MSTKKNSDNRPVTPWWEKISYEGFLATPCKIFHPSIFLHLTGNEFKLAEYLTFLRWRFADQFGVMTLAVCYLARGTGLSEGSIKRLMKSLEKKKFLKCLRVNKNWRTSVGNEYLIFRLLLWEKSGSEIDQFDLSSADSQGMTDQIDPSDRSKRSVIGVNSGTMTDQNDLQDHIQTNSYSVNDNASHQRCPTDRSKGNGEAKGIRLTSDDFPKTATGLVAKLDAEIERRQKERAS